MSKSTCGMCANYGGAFCREQLHTDPACSKYMPVNTPAIAHTGITAATPTQDAETKQMDTHKHCSNCANHDNIKFEIPNYAQYMEWRKGTKALSLEVNNATLSIPPSVDIFETYRALQSTFCEMLCLENRFFMEN